MKRLLGFKEVAVIRKGEIGIDVDKNRNPHYAQILSLDFKINNTTSIGIGIISFSLGRVPYTLLFIIGVMRE